MDIYNWARSVRIGRKRQVVRPLSEEELQALLVSNLRDKERKIKCLGSGMSYSAIAEVESSASDDHDNHDDEGVLLDLHSPAFVGLVQMGEGWARFGASTVMEDVAGELLKHGLQLTSCPGVLMTQTLAGALATGTHGQGLRNAGLYDSVLSMRVVLADGSIKEFSPTNADPEESESFHAFQIHAGALGIITQVTLACEPQICYRVEKEITDFDMLLKSFQSWNEGADHCKAWWFPSTDHVQLWRGYKASPVDEERYRANGSNMVVLEGSGIGSGGGLLGSRTGLFKSSIDDLLHIMKSDTGGNDDSKAKTDFEAARFQTVTRFRSLQSCIGNIYQLWCKGIPAPQVNCEIAVPLSALTAVLVQLKQYYRSKMEGEGLEMHYPFILRATGSSRAWLSPAHNEPVCYIGFLVYLSEDQITADPSHLGFKHSREKLKLLSDIEAAIAGSHSKCIPHLGKFFTPRLYRPWVKWSHFRALMLKLDPRGIFRNKFIEELFLHQ